MPYIQDARRVSIAQRMGMSIDMTGQLFISKFDHPHQLLGPGELNFAITLLMHRYVLERGQNYAVLSEAHSQASLAAAEFYRAVIGPYEDGKVKENGPISRLDTNA